MEAFLSGHQPTLAPFGDLANYPPYLIEAPLLHSHHPERWVDGGIGPFMLIGLRGKIPSHFGPIDKMSMEEAASGAGRSH